MRRLVAIAIALVGCATAAPPPVRVSERDLGEVRATIAKQSSDTAPASDYLVSRIEVREREVTLELARVTNGRGWKRTDRAVCRRCADEHDWSCAQFPASVEAAVPGGSAASVHGLSGDEAVSAIRFLLEESDSDPALKGIPLPQLETIVRLRSLSEQQICVLFGATQHHAGSSFGQLVLLKQGSGFRVESVVPPPNWFEGGAGFECGVSEFEIPPILRGCRQ